MFQLLNSGDYYKKNVDELAPQIWSHELKSSCGTHIDKHQARLISSESQKATKDQVEYTGGKKSPIQQACEGEKKQQKKENKAQNCL